MSLYIGKDIHRYDWVHLPIDDEVVNRVEKLSKIEKQANFYQNPMFEWAPGIPILGDISGNEEEISDEENPEDDLVEAIVEEIAEE